MKEIRRQLRLNGKTYRSLWIIYISVAIFVPLLINIVIKLVGDPGEKTILFGTLTLQSVIVFGTSLITLLGCMAQFDMCLKMGAVRKHYLGAFLILQFVLCFLSLYIAQGFIWIDQALTVLVGIPYTSGYQMPVSLMLLLSVFCIGAAFWIGGLIRQFGKKAFWVFWAIWMIVMLQGSRIIQWMTQSSPIGMQKIIRVFSSLITPKPHMGLFLLLFCMGLLMSAHGYWLMRKTTAV